MSLFFMFPFSTENLAVNFRDTWRQVTRLHKRQKYCDKIKRNHLYINRDVFACESVKLFYSLFRLSVDIQVFEHDGAESQSAILDII